MIGSTIRLLTTIRLDQVKDLQEKLNNLLECAQGYTPIKTNGILSGETIEAIRILQRTLGIAADGFIKPGSPTEAALKKENITIVNPFAACEAAREARIRGAIIKSARIVERSGWGAAKPAHAMKDDWNYHTIVVHHAGNSYSCSANPEKQMRDAQKDELAKGADDIGYHYGIACNGTVYEARDIRRKGEHVLKNNKGMLGIVLLADFTVRGEGLRFGKNETAVGRMRDRLDVFNEDAVPQAQLDALKKTIVLLRQYFPIMKLGGHREAAKSGDERSCPGDIVLKVLASLRAQYGLAPP